MTDDTVALTPPFLLRLLGTPELRDATGRPVDAVLAQPKRLALLVRVAMAGEHGLERDELVELLWPNLKPARGRNALRQSLHFLRRHLGADSLRTTDEFRVVLDRGIVRCDVHELITELAHDRVAALDDRRTAGLASGLHVSYAGRFHDWLDEARRSLETMLATVVRAGATADDAASGVAPAAAASIPLGDSGPARVGLVRRRRRMTVGALAATVALMGGAAWAALPAPLSVPPAERVVLLPFAAAGDQAHRYLAEGMVDLLTARLSGVPGLRLVDGRADARTRAASPSESSAALQLARALDAGHVLVGSLRDSAGHVRIEATLLTASGNAVSTLRATASSDSGIYTAIDDVARQLILARNMAEGELSRLAARTSPSFDALRAWLEGEHAYREGRYVAAGDAFLRATQIDSTFALAHFRYSLATAAASGGRDNAAHLALPKAMRHAERLSARDRLIVRALWEDWYGSDQQAERFYRRAIVERPDDAEAWYGLGDVIFHHAALRGRGIAASRDAFEQVLSLDSLHLGAVVHLGRIAAASLDLGLLAQLARHERSLRPPSGLPGEVAWIDAVARDRRDTVASMAGALSAASYQVAEDFAWKAATYGGDPAVAIRLLAPRSEGDRPQAVRVASALAIAHFETARGRPAVAREWLERVRAIAPTSALQAEAALAWAAPPSLEVAQVAMVRLARWRRAIAGRALPGTAWERQGLPFAAAQLEIALEAAMGRDSVAARVLDASVERTDERAVEGALQAHLLAVAKAHLLAMRGEPGRALELLESRDRDALPHPSATFVAASERLLRARLLHALGRTDEARRWLATIPAYNGADAAAAPAALLLRARWLAARGDQAGAAREAAWMLRYLRDAEPSERVTLQEARRLSRGLPLIALGNGR